MSHRLSLLILLAVGVMLIVFHENVIETLEDWFGPKDARPVVATLESFEGVVNYKLPKTLYYKKVKQGLGLRNQDTVVTDETSKAVISFASGFRLEISPNSIVIIEEPTVGDDGQIRITFLRGDFRVIDQGTAGKIIVSKDNVSQDPAGRTPLKPIQITAKPTPTPIPTPQPTPTIKQEELDEVKTKIVQKATPKPIKKAKETLPDDYIAQIIKKQTPFFNRCYAEHLRLNPNARGRINITFAISPNGMVSNVRIIDSTLKDPRLEQCTLSVVERARFRKYDGDPVIVNYPINFE